MSAVFDPYHTWLGIPPQEQPPNHYRLLGIQAFEEKAEVIESAADRQMMHLRSYQSGKHSALSQRLLNEVAAAKLCLLRPATKADYDARLRASLAPSTAPQTPSPQAESSAAIDLGFELPANAPHAGKRSASGKRRPWWPAAAAVAACAVLILALAVKFGGDEKRTAQRPDPKPAAQPNPGKTTSEEPKAKNAPDRSDQTAPPDEKWAKLAETTMPASAAAPTETQNPAAESPSQPVGNAVPEETPPESGPGEEPSESAFSKLEPASAMPPAADPLATRKLPVPDAAALKSAEKLVKDVFLQESAKKKNMAEKLTLAKSCLERGLQTKDDAAAQFVLLRSAKDTAVEIGDGETALRAVDALTETFEIDALQMKLDALLKCVKMARMPAHYRTILTLLLPVLDEALAKDDFNAARRLAELAVNVSRATKDAALMKTARERSADVRKAADAREAVQAAVKTLEETPNDPEANRIVGEYLCFCKGNWTEGLPKLAAGTGEPAKTLAANDLQGAASPEARVKLADAWWDFSASQHGVAVSRVQERAVHWYKLALPGLKGLSREVAVKRLTEFKPVGAIPQHRVFTFNEKAVAEGYWEWSGDWEFANDGAKGPSIPGSFIRTRHAYGGNLTIDIDMSFNNCRWSNWGHIFINIWGKRLNITDQWGKMGARVHIHREGNEIVFILNQKEQRIPIEPEVWLEPTAFEVRWHQRPSHFRHVEIKADIVLPVKPNGAPQG